MTMHLPRRVSDDPGSPDAWPLHDAAATRAIERRALAASEPHALMERAGLAVARLALALAPHARCIAVMAGPGNNGGDGLVAARHLAALGRQVRVQHLADPARLPADAADALKRACAAGLAPSPLPPDLGDCDLVVDALLGVGATRSPDGVIAHAIAQACQAARPVLAVDLPSGLNPDTGRRLGDLAVRADRTLSLLTLKPGLFTADGRDHAGEVWLDTLDFGDADGSTALLGHARQPPAPGFAPRRHAQHKGSFGDTLIIGGAAGMHGAAWLASKAALVAGAGRVFVSLLDQAPPNPPSPEVMVRHKAWLWPADALARLTVVCGCGGGDAVTDALPPLLDHVTRLVLDADALNATAADPRLRDRLSQRARSGLETVLTPHPLEAARLLGCGVDAVQADRLRAARTLAAQLQAVVVLKGSGTVVARPDGQLWINPTGNARLAAPGSGDVLAGWLGGCWSGSAPSLATAAWFAARATAWLHGRAAEWVDDGALAPGHLPLTAGRLIEDMARVLG